MHPLQDVAPVRTIQVEYFDLLRHFFGGPYEQMTKYHLTPATVASDMCTNASLVKALHGERDEFIQTFVDFWETRQLVVEDYLSNVEFMKSFFGGDISPVVQVDHLSSTLLYTDTVVLQCPILRLIPLLQLGSPEHGLRLVVKHALNVMRYEELATADVEPPILLVTGSSFAISEEYRRDLSTVSEPYVLAQAKALTGRDFADIGELRQFLSNIKNEDEAIQAIRDPNRALFDTDWTGSLDDQFHRNLVEVTSSLQLPPSLSKAAFTLHQLISGRMLQANEIVILNSSIRATPLLSAPTSWQYLMWRYEFDAAFTSPEMNPDDLLITNAIMTRGDRNEIPLLSGLSPKAIVALRKEGAMASLRDIMNKSVRRIDAASRFDLREVSKEVSRELSDAFDAHDRQLSELRTSRKRFYGLDVASSIATGLLTLAGAATGHTSLAVLGAASSALVGSKSVPALREAWLEIRGKEQEVKRSPAAILLRNLG